VRKFRDSLISAFGKCQEAGQLFYLATVFTASMQVRSLLDAGKSVVLDRYFLSTQAYAAFRGSALHLDELGAHLVPATLTVFTDARLDVRIGRLCARGATSADLETMEASADARLRREHLDRFALPFVGRPLHLDSTHDRPEALVARIVEAALSAS
jgi:dTMP kinase